MTKISQNRTTVANLLANIVLYIVSKTRKNGNFAISLVHMLSSTVLTGYILWNVLEFSAYDIFDIFVQVNQRVETTDSRDIVINVFYNSIGYFLADSAFIILSRESKLYVFIWHHVIAILLCSMVFFGEYTPILGIFIFEFGGIPYHFRRLVPHTASEILFQILYLPSRIVIYINLLRVSNLDSVFCIFRCLFTHALIGLNVVWWWKITRPQLQSVWTRWVSNKK